MPIYLSKKTDFSIPQETFTEESDSTTYLNDPDLLFDLLPQPFRLVDKIINGIYSNAWSFIQDNINLKAKLSLESNVETSESQIWPMEFGKIQSLTQSDTMENTIFVGFEGTMLIIDIENKVIIDNWQSELENPVEIETKYLCKNIEIIVAVDGDGSGKIYTVTHGRFYLVKKFAATTTETGCQIVKMELDDKCNFCSVFYDQSKDNQQWVEVHKLPREQWMKELEAIGKAYREYVATQATTNDANQQTESTTEPTTILDRYGLKIASTTLLMKAKYPDTISSPPCNGLSQLMKQIDTGGAGGMVNMGIGMNHTVTGEFMDIQRTQFKEDTSALCPTFENNVEEPSFYGHLGHTLFCYTVGRLCPSVGDTTAGQEPTILINWWNDSQHLLLFNLSNKPSKGGTESWTKHDASRSFSCTITAIELTENHRLLAIGLANGHCIIIDIQSGLMNYNVKLSNTSIKAIRFLQNRLDKMKCIISVMDCEYRLFGIDYHQDPINFQLTYLTEVDSSYVQSLKIISNNSSLAILTDKSEQLMLYDLRKGTKYLYTVMQPDEMISNIWDPLVAITKNRKHICVAGYKTALTNQTESESPENLVLETKENTDELNHKEEHSIFIFSLNEDQETWCLKPECDDEISMKPHNNSPDYISVMADDYLRERFCNHVERQRILQNVWDNLEHQLTNLTNVVVS